jgi:molybdopterin synthase catalytic subunit
MVSLVETVIDPGVLMAAVRTASHGGIASFVGFVRDNHAGRAVLGLEYSAYGPMAEAEMARIADEARSRWAAEVSLAHRVGRLEVGEIAVAIAVSTPHRAAAFEACRYVIEEVKCRVPIWKREFFADGSTEWVDPSVTTAGTT